MQPDSTILPNSAAEAPLSERLRRFVANIRSMMIESITDDGMMLIATDGLGASNVPFKLFLDAADALDGKQQPKDDKAKCCFCGKVEDASYVCESCDAGGTEQASSDAERLQ